MSTATWHQWSFAIALATLSALGAGGAQAALVSVSMELNMFTGNVGSDTQFTTYFALGYGPEVVCPTAGCGTGVGTLRTPLLGTDYFEFWEHDRGFAPVPLPPDLAERTHNLIRFVSSGEKDVAIGEPFVLGSLTFSNGIWFSAPTMTVTFRSSSSDPLFDDHTWPDVWRFRITNNLPSISPTRDARADYIYLSTAPSFGSIRAYELNDPPGGGNTVTVDIEGAIGSLDLLRFANARGAGFIDPSIDLEPTPRPVPEPDAWALLIMGMAFVGFVTRRKPHRTPISTV
jgi:hypothetical protein